MAEGYKDILTAEDISNFFLPVVKRTSMDWPAGLPSKRAYTQQELGWRSPYPKFNFGDLEGLTIGGERYWVSNTINTNPEGFGIIELKVEGDIKFLWMHGEQGYQDGKMSHHILYELENSRIKYTDALFSSNVFGPVIDLES